MHMMDTINASMGKASIRLAGEGMEGNWAMKRGRSSQAFTSNLRALPTVFAC